MTSSSYQKQLDELLKNIAITEKDSQSKSEHDIKSNVDNSCKPKQTLLLHACCGPCSSYVLEYLSQYFAITVFYYNPNIYPQEEYNRRLSELKTFYTKFAPAANVRVVEEVYDPEDFYNAIQIHEHPERAAEPEKGERCRLCYKFRLQKAYEYAKAHNYDYYCTTLSISPFKDAEKINVLGTEIAKNQQVAGIDQQMSGDKQIVGKQSVPSNQSTSPRWLPSDFKKRGGFQRSLELSTEYGLYRQKYCGCIYSSNKSQD